MLGNYFTKMRLYRVDQPIVAQYLATLWKSKNMSVKDVTDNLPEKYLHTVGHWFRKDFGGSIPIPSDIDLLEDVLDVKEGLLHILKKHVLKFQTGKASIKGRNPGDLLEGFNETEIISHPRKLYTTHS